jgi:hypothetical protein
MAGGLLNIIAQGNNNIFLTGNPSKTFFKVTYAKHTNFGLQKFRTDFDGQRDLRLTEPSTFTFKINRYAELLMDTYVVITLPDIWSPIYPPCANTNGYWTPYEFRWIKDLGIHMIQEITITCGSLTLQRYTGDYLAAMVERDFSAEKKDLFNKMTGNLPELNDPASCYGRSNSYPSASYTTNSAGAEPSIRGRTLHIPINTWFTLNSQCAFPLICLQYNELIINVTIRPIQELFRVRDVFDITYAHPYVQADFTQPHFQMYRFLQTPPSPLIQAADYQNKTVTWNADIHLLSTYCFLSKDEAKLFAAEDQVYLVKDVFRYTYQNISGTTRVKLTSNGMIANWMFYLQRNDVNLRNEWSNYTNWPYDTIPENVVLAPNTPNWLSQIQTPAVTALLNNTVNGVIGGLSYGIGVHYNNNLNSGITITGDYHPENQKDILVSMAILLDGEYRENTQIGEVYNYVEKYVRTAGAAKEGIYCYNFGLNTSPFEYQPSGALNLSKFKNIELEVSTTVPPIDTISSQYNIICDINGNPIGTSKSNWRLYGYTFNMVVFEERYNILSFIGGNAGMLYAR